MEEVKWDVANVLNDNTSTFIVKDLPEENLLLAFYIIFQYLELYNNEDDANYDILYYAEPELEPKNQFFIFTNLPYSRFIDYNPEFLFEE